MKKSFIFKSMLMIALICMPFVWTSCSDDEDKVTTVMYSMGFNKMNSSNPSEMGTIETVYQQALGVNSNNFTLSGSISECDNKVKSACKNAESNLKSKTFKGSYLFVVTNYTSQKEIYSYQIN